MIEQVEVFRDNLRNEVQAILGDNFIVNASISTLGGIDHASVCLEIYGKDPAYNIKHNSKCFMHLWMHNCLLANKSCESSNTNRQLKFRKIRANSFDVMTQKICDFFRSRKNLMLELESKK